MPRVLCPGCKKSFDQTTARPACPFCARIPKDGAVKPESDDARFKVVGYFPAISEEEPATVAVAQSLEQAIRAWEREGWAFVRVEHVSYAERSGCLGMFFTRRFGTAQVLVLERAPPMNKP